MFSRAEKELYIMANDIEQLNKTIDRNDSYVNDNLAYNINDRLTDEMKSDNIFGFDEDYQQHQEQENDYDDEEYDLSYMLL